MLKHMVLFKTQREKHGVNVNDAEFMWDKLKRANLGQK